MSAVRPGEVVKSVPFLKLCFEVDIALVAEKLVELLLVGPV